MSIFLINFSGLIILLSFWLFLKDLNIAYVFIILIFLFFFLLLFFFIRFKNKKKIANIILIAYLICFLVFSHTLLKDRNVVWKKGFSTNEFVGWYPIKNMNKQALIANSKEYIVSTDKFGHRNFNTYPEKRSIELLIQGDSNVFGFGLKTEDTICIKLESLINKKCFNFGVPGFDMQHFYFQFEKFNKLFNVNHRIILFNVGNDYGLSALSTPYLLPRPFLYLDKKNNLKKVIDINIPFKAQVYGHKFIPIYSDYNQKLSTVSIGRDWGNWMPKNLSNFYLLMFAFELTYPRITKLFVENFQQEKISQGKLLNPYYPEWQLRKFSSWPSPYKDYWKQFKELLRQISQQNVKKNTIVIFPYKRQIEKYKKYMSKEVFTIQKKLIEEANLYSINIIDLTPSFLDHSNYIELYQEDQHLSARGIEFITKIINKHNL